VKVECVTYVSSKASLIAGISTGSIALWRRRFDYAPSHLPTMHFAAHGGAVKQVCHVSNLDLVATASLDRHIRLWDLWQPNSKRALVQTLSGHGGGVICLEVCEDLIVSGSTDCTVRVWKGAIDPLGIVLYPWYQCTQVIKMGTWIYSLSFSPDVRVAESRGFADGEIYLGDGKGAITVYSISEGTELQFVRKLPALHSLAVTAMHYSVKDSLLISTGADLWIRVYAASTGIVLASLQSPNGSRIHSVSWDPLYKEVMFADDMGMVWLWNIFSDKISKSWQVSPRWPVHFLAFQSSTEELLLLTTGTIEFWSIQRQAQYSEFAGHTAPVTSLKVVDGPGNPEAHLIASAGEDDTIQVWDISSMRHLKKLTPIESEVLCLGYSAYNHTLLSGHEDGSLCLWNPDSGVRIKSMKHKNSVTCMTVGMHKSCEYIWSGSYDGTFIMWDSTKVTERGAHYLRSTQVGVEVYCISYMAAKNTLYVGANNGGEILTYNATLLGVPSSKLSGGHTEPVTAMALDGFFLLSAAEDGRVSVWNTVDNTLLTSFTAHQEPVRGMCVIEETGLLCTCAYDNTLKLWDYKKDEPLKIFHHPEKFCCVSYNKGKCELLAGTVETHILAFPVPMQLQAGYVEEDQATTRTRTTISEGSQSLGDDETAMDDIAETIDGSEIDLPFVPDIDDDILHRATYVRTA
jgi:WD40 repeat protein